jgi:DNA-binding FadR family transcriptional regulator
MERFVVTHTKDGLWSVSHQEHTLSVYQTEELALSAIFKLASQFSQPGHRAVVSMIRAGAASEARQSMRIHRGYS